MDTTMGNQQVNISWEWLAGFYDGEGSLMLTKSESKGYIRYAPSLDLVNTDHVTMQAIVEFLRLHGISVYVFYSKKHPKFHRDANRRHKQRMIIRIARMAQVKCFLGYITPYLNIKRQNAWLLLEFVDTRAERYTKTSDRDHEIYSQLKQLTVKGKLIESSEANTPHASNGEDRVQP
jgi:hypothetical protein